jgi:hypothetical protein
MIKCGARHLGLSEIRIKPSRKRLGYHATDNTYDSAFVLLLVLQLETLQNKLDRTIDFGTGVEICVGHSRGRQANEMLG